ncbi:efflux RND transporter periplasmic adaptor subunit [Corallincola luteus]|uniref:Efflux RND transporter periplasmic adaptor subunit n=1 Tax=Corallincola luteus TaxID=1775177 RepID=A0ABY2AQ69_9GAMM|nr:efflux RND transporter periplasmic adaptor subunit [Corallincola luteus]TCI05340.1 efflux RND transporter periplasmic adaptor subunit [Corallincola luteus]
MQRFIVLPFAVLAVLLLAACSDVSTNELESPNLLTVGVQPAQKSDGYTVTREYVGTIQANQKANLGSELSGKVSRIMVDIGEEIQAGQALIRLDTQLLETEREQLIAQLHEIEAQLKLTIANLNRQLSLRSKGFSSEADIDALSSQKESLEANLQRIQSFVNANNLKQEKSVIRAPYSGIVSDRFVSLGDVVSIGEPTMALLSSGNKEAVIGVYKGDAKGIIDQGHFSVDVDGDRFPAVLISTPSNIDLRSRNVRLRFSLKGGAEALDGDLARLSYQKKFTETGYWLPNTALIDGIRGTWNIYVIAENDSQKVVESRSVEVIYSDSHRVYIQGALLEGEEIIVSGLHKVVPGQTVKVAQGR